jgi:cell division protein FtsQ
VDGRGQPLTNRRQKSRARKVPRAPQDSGGGEAESFGSEALLPKKRWLEYVKSALGLLVALAGALALAFGAHRYALATPRFALVNVEIEGERRLAQGEILTLGGVELGKNLLALDLDRVEKALGSSPWIRAVRVERRLPGTLSIELEEREPRALVLRQGELHLVSERGEPFKAWVEGDPRDFPIISGAESSGPEGATENRLQEGVKLLDDYAHTTLGASLSAEELHFSAQGEAVLTVGREGVELYLGLPPFRDKLNRAERVVLEAKSLGGLPGAVFLDSRAHPERVVVRAR